jgi:hypothetical protein
MKYNNKIYTGEGFKNEKLFTVMAAVVTIISSVVLIHLSMLQRKHIKMQMEELDKKNGIK